MKQLCWLILLALPGCSILVDDPIKASIDHGGAKSFLLDEWEFRGRLSAKDLVKGDGKQANIRWLQQSDNTTVILTGPFGSAAQKIFWDSERILLTDNDSELEIEYFGSDAIEDFFQDQLGWTFPVSSIRFWLSGSLDPNEPGQEIFSQDGQLSELKQQGWRISYESYFLSGGIMMPRRLTLESARARLRIVISKWYISSSSE
ncbi:MAG: outer membrane lipoprotein LolB [Pseudomonadota bacterium]|nr:outer membrane lipoprotein LolB [Pseudomonadota bacterium]